MRWMLSKWTPIPAVLTFLAFEFNQWIYEYWLIDPVGLQALRRGLNWPLASVVMMIWPSRNQWTIYSPYPVSIPGNPPLWLLIRFEGLWLILISFVIGAFLGRGARWACRSAIRSF